MEFHDWQCHQVWCDTWPCGCWALSTVGENFSEKFVSKNFFYSFYLFDFFIYGILFVGVQLPLSLSQMYCAMFSSEKKKGFTNCWISPIGSLSGTCRQHCFFACFEDSSPSWGESVPLRWSFLFLLNPRILDNLSFWKNKKSEFQASRQGTSSRTP